MNEGLDIPTIKEAVSWLNVTTAFRDGYPVPDQIYWDALIDAVLACRFSVKSGWKIYRARIMPFEQELDDCPLPCDKMGAPHPENAKVGRLNGKGVTCLYGALDHETAIAEVRPWRGSRVSVARFISTTELTLADLTGVDVNSKYGRSVQWLSFMLGRPVHQDDTESYLPSQYVAEECRSAGLDGVLYDSSLKKGGVNAAIFMSSKLRCQEVELREVTAMALSTQLLHP